MTFNSLHEKWLTAHLKQRKGESWRRLVDGHGHAEKLFLEAVWYAAFRQFEHLHPEYEVSDFRDGTRFIDFAYIRHSLRLAIEIDGFQTHAANINRWQFSDSRIRQNHLIIDGWTILRFSYDDIKDKPMMCIQLLQQFMGSRLPEQSIDTNVTNLLENEIIRLALHLGRPLKPVDVRKHLQISKQKTSTIICAMVKSHKLLPDGTGTQRVYSYKLNRAMFSDRTF
ncbi:MAG: DNA-binding response regulator [Candidatus Pristimantibacillus sp.]